ncbi:hypothetical protein QOZ84_10675 [Romboutsia sedimentorum]|uniref:Uncharacterized protein n=1 Tax=Romboutsia sedimentorum TaxID=1368474 RepID=A0ABT7EAR3_9FIRM|nr:hypothetical protein [Romboutsia sedimentorum]MDK2564016.1 hypothetical protein [Romboutsia sedimentorum]
MKNKKNLTDSILKNIGDGLKKNVATTNKFIKNEDVKSNSFIMVPTNHPNIDEILKLLNNFKEDNVSEEIKEEAKKSVITLSDILNSNQEKLIIPKHSIITPMAKDYIKQKKIKVIFTENKEQ